MTELEPPSGSERRRPGYYLPKADGTVDIAVLQKRLDDECIAEFDQVTQVVFDLQPIIFAFEIVERNRVELLDAVARYPELLREPLTRYPGVHPLILDCLVEATQKLTNFLASVSAFLDHANAAIGQRHGRASQQANSWNEKRRALHARHFSYRFLYELRHFAQHYSLPLSIFNIQGRRASQVDPMGLTIELKASRNGLLQESFKWKKLRSEIEAQPPEFPLLPLVEEYFDAMRRLCHAAVALEASRLADCSQYLVAWKKALDIPDNAVPVVFVGESKSAGRPPERTEHVPFTQFVRIMELANRLSKHVGQRPSG